jgi:hypothetical protein
MATRIMKRWIKYLSPFLVLAACGIVPGMRVSMGT